MKQINLQDMPREESKAPDDEDLLTGDTSLNAGHRHIYVVDENGNGEALMAYSPKNPLIRHKHKVINWVVQTAKSKCYPDCEDNYGAKGLPYHVHQINRNTKIELDGFTNDSKTSSLYNGREKYKKLVNDGNQPIGIKNINKNASLVNHLDLWYKDSFYGKYDYDLRLVKFSNEKALAGVRIGPEGEESEFVLLDFVADAVQNFLYQYNDQRDPHPNSILNDIKVVRAYEPPQDYSSYFFDPEQGTGVYADFFYDYLQNLKDAEKIKDIYDFLDLFYVWAISNKTAITETGFYESQNCTIYNTGLSFDYMDITSEEQKQEILNDPRFPVLNYVAKINGLRIDPNYPARLIADINSKPMLEFAASGPIPLIGKETSIDDRPPAIYEKYFAPINFINSSQKHIATFFAQIERVYRRFITKYPTYSVYISDSGQQEHRRKFDTSKILRTNIGLDAFYSGVDTDIQILSKRALKYYIMFRALERNMTINKKQLNDIAETMYVLNTVACRTALNADLKKLISLTKRQRELNAVAEEIGLDTVGYATRYGLSIDAVEQLFEIIVEELEILVPEKSALEKKFIGSVGFTELITIGSQAVNYLETFLKPLPSKNKKDTKTKMGFLSSWRRGAGLILTDIINYYILEPVVDETVAAEGLGQLSTTAQELLAGSKYASEVEGSSIEY